MSVTWAVANMHHVHVLAPAHHTEHRLKKNREITAIITLSNLYCMITIKMSWSLTLQHQMLAHTHNFRITHTHTHTHACDPLFIHMAGPISIEPCQLHEGLSWKFCVSETMHSLITAMDQQLVFHKTLFSTH